MYTNISENTLDSPSLLPTELLRFPPIIKNISIQNNNINYKKQGRKVNSQPLRVIRCVLVHNQLT